MDRIQDLLYSAKHKKADLGNGRISMALICTNG